MKKTLLFLGLLLPVLYSHAQRALAITGGLHSATVSPHFLSYPDTANKTALNKGRVMFGFVANVPIRGGLHFRTGVVYSAKGSNWSQFYDTLDVYHSPRGQLLSSKTELNVNYIDVPLNLMYKLPIKKKSRFIVGGGPQVSLLYTGNKYFYTTTVTQPDLEGEVKYDYSQDINKDLPIGKATERYRIVHLGANAFAGLEFNRVFLTVNYSRGLQEFYEEAGRNYKHQTIGASLGIYIGKPVSEKPVKEVAIPQQPKDTDGDSVTDDKDKCPEVAGVAKYEGCPVPDSDSDGVHDEEDQCPQVAGLAKYNGCPVPDSDGDGLNDEEDQCKDVAGVAKYQGCPVPDTDKDGINDEEDKCPQVAGTAANGGCPEVKEEVVEKVAYAAKNIYFDKGSARLQNRSFAPLDEVVAILNEHADLKLSIEGHTDNTGTDEVNQAMSEARAKAVKAYLVKKGIDEARITAQGFGESRPVADNNTPAGRAQNRRVVLQVNY